MANTVKADSWRTGFWPVKTANGGTPLIQWETIAAGEAVKAGDAVTKASGEISLGLATSGLLYGIALADGSATESIPVAVAELERFSLVRLMPRPRTSLTGQPATSLVAQAP